MRIKIVAYGIARDILGGSSLELEIKSDSSVDELRDRLMEDYPELAKLTSLRIALNQSYAVGQENIAESDEIVLIPPVCGG